MLVILNGCVSEEKERVGSELKAYDKNVKL